MKPAAAPRFVSKFAATYDKLFEVFIVFALFADIRVDLHTGIHAAGDQPAREPGAVLVELALAERRQGVPR